MSALVLRIKFPPTYPLIYKTLRVDANFNAKEAVKFIADTVNVSNLLVGSEGLYIPDEKKWLDDTIALSTYDSLQDVVCSFSLIWSSNFASQSLQYSDSPLQEHIEFKDRNSADSDSGPSPSSAKSDGGGGCCTIS